MILVDSSVWIDRFRGRTTLQTAAFEKLNQAEQLFGYGDLILAEVLQGTRNEERLIDALSAMQAFEYIVIADYRVAIQAARNYQHLRARGVTVRKTIDTLIATRCILDNIPLLYADRDFDPFVEHLGLRSAVDEAVN